MSYPHLELELSEVPDGVLVRQSGSAYLARGWRLTPEVKYIVRLALEAGLISMIQRDHPRESNRLPNGAGADYLTFAPSEHHRWVFVLDMDSCPRRRAPTKVKFSKTYKHALRRAGIACPPEWRSPQELIVAVEDLSMALSAAAPLWDRLGHRQGKAMERGLHDHFIDEEDLHAHIVQNWERTLRCKGLELIASRFLLGGLAHRQGEIDILARDKAGLVVVELKNRAVWNTGGETPDRQLIRYMTHPDLLELASQKGDAIRGILIAQEMDHKLRRAVRASTHPIVAFEATKASEKLVLAEVARSDSA
ncbi:endonuclease NucS domain-containing protein [Limimaricola soesokkakensis]|uniref:endonuclease NucS domain-containing protein n=2 Tax=Limimaricola soesokkakensis TaxID=1343159 RepID=UPI00355A17FA